MKDKVSKTELFLFDLDGTIYKGKNLIGNVKETLMALRNAGKRLGFLTNNSSVTNRVYIEKLKSMQIYEKGDIVYSSLDCAVDFLNSNRNGKKIYALASDDVDKYLISQGISLVQENADIVLLTFDKEIDYQKMILANEYLVLGKEYIATHPDIVCPTESISIPDVGSYIEFFKASSGRTPDVILGKPYKFMAEYLVTKTGIPLEKMTMVGDRLYTDIQFGINSNMNTILVLSGETDLDTARNSKIKADLMLNDVNEIPKLLNL